MPRAKRSEKGLLTPDNCVVSIAGQTMDYMSVAAAQLPAWI